MVKWKIKDCLANKYKINHLPQNMFKKRMRKKKILDYKKSVWKWFSAMYISDFNSRNISIFLWSFHMINHPEIPDPEIHPESSSFILFIFRIIYTYIFIYVVILIIFKNTKSVYKPKIKDCLAKILYNTKLIIYSKM